MKRGDILIVAVTLAVLACLSGLAGELKDYRRPAPADYAAAIAAQADAQAEYLAALQAYLELVDGNAPKAQRDAAKAVVAARKAAADAAKADKDKKKKPK